MKKIIYRKSDLERVGTIQSDTTLEWQIQNNVIPNFSGVSEDYDYVETTVDDNLHLERINGKVIAVEDNIVPTLDDIRATRNVLLAQSDWTQLPDSPVNKTDWAEYRQALRDFPASVDLDNVVWPEKPE